MKRQHFGVTVDKVYQVTYQKMRRSEEGSVASPFRRRREPAGPCWLPLSDCSLPFISCVFKTTFELLTVGELEEEAAFPKLSKLP